MNSHKLFRLLATCFGMGTVSWILAPGTFVSLVSIVPWYFLNRFFSWWVLFFILMLLIGFGCYVCHQVNKEISVVHDHKSIVLDEFIGMWFVLILSLDSNNCTFVSVLFCFLFFRICDILKPWPISFIDANIRNGLGIVFDDIAAAGISVVLIFFFNGVCTCDFI